MVRETYNVTGTVTAVTIPPIMAIRAAVLPSDAEAPQDGVIRRLEDAGRTVLALSHRGYSTHLRPGGLDYVRDAMEAYGWSAETIRPAAPDSASITAMDEAYAWLNLIPTNRYVLRRIAGARSLVHPVTDKHLYPWRKIATAIGADHKAAQRWHAEAVNIIVGRLAENNSNRASQTPQNMASI